MLSLKLETTFCSLMMFSRECTKSTGSGTVLGVLLERWLEADCRTREEECLRGRGERGGVRAGERARGERVGGDGSARGGGSVGCLGTWFLGRGSASSSGLTPGAEDRSRKTEEQKAEEQRAEEEQGRH